MSVSRHKLRVWPRKTGENMQISGQRLAGDARFRLAKA
ncbi:hypothetical protein BN1012_Phect53 [Candidatus Phaeomarinobacter ectocarpi]|uniref:Uncharacterized protein n=1 Tax=Candidatus Phaeomarinibacter ectocarpi TaxID=1458461 RepID=X5MBL0_9HYPH|nr:hypothetical protein BN1012_Phect53 [Candidatus Phaeomarinobacter ectocarpi]